MKALLYKDVLLLWKHGRDMLLYLAIVAVVSYRLLDGGLAAANGIGLLFLLVLIPSDLDAHWLDVLPIAPKARIWSKYLEFWVLSLANFLLVWAASVVSPSQAITREVLVVFLVYWCICLAIQAVFFPVLSMFSTQNKWTYSFFFLSCFLGYFAGLIPLGLLRESPLTPADVLPYLGLLFAASVVSAPMAVSQYRKGWPKGKIS